MCDAVRDSAAETKLVKWNERHWVSRGHGEAILLKFDQTICRAQRCDQAGTVTFEFCDLKPAVLLNQLAAEKFTAVRLF